VKWQLTVADPIAVRHAASSSLVIHCKAMAASQPHSRTLESRRGSVVTVVVGASDGFTMQAFLPP